VCSSDLWKSPFVPGVAPISQNFTRQRTIPDTSGNWLPEFVQKDQTLKKVEAIQPDTSVCDQYWKVDLSPSQGVNVLIAPHDVAFNTERQLWYCDIEIDNKSGAYFPFIRLALARYQPISVTSAHLSEVVLADFMQLVPDRWLSVTKPATEPMKRNVHVYGPAYASSSSFEEAKKADGATSIAQKSVIKIWVEKLDANAILGEEFGWVPEDKAIISEFPFHDPKEYPLWAGSVILPPDNSRYRLVVAEYEEYLVDDDKPYEDPPTHKGERLVFVEYVNL
jgi:hypothetical protein